MHACEGEPVSFGRVGQCHVGPLRRKALEVVIFLLTGVAMPYFLSWWRERKGGGQRRAGGQMTVGETWGCCLRYLAHGGPGTDDRAQNLGPAVGPGQRAGWAIKERPRNRTTVGL